MKKIYILSMFTMLTLPGIAGQDVHKMYGQEPREIIRPEIAAQYGQQFEDNEYNDANKTEYVQKTYEIKNAENVQNMQNVQKTEYSNENKIIRSSGQEESYNPKIKFPHGLQLGIGLSPTSGLNGFIGYNNKNFDSFWAKRFGIRFDFATYAPIKNKLNKRINEEIDDDGVKIKDSLKIDNFALDAKHYGAMIDFYPFGNTWFLGGWRLSGGYFAGKLDLTADIHGKVDGDKIEFELNKKKYFYDGTQMHGRAMADWKYNGPYLGTGFDLGLFWGIKIYMDAGVVFTGNTAKFDLDVPFAGLKNENGTEINPESDDPIIHDAYVEFIKAKDAALADARKEIKDYPYYPLVKLGFMYRF